MPPSYRKINYRLRPGKSIERKMMCETFARLSTLHPVSQFQYVGYGSTYFADFVLVHKLLGISKMVSIERQCGAEERFRLNLPFDCIEIKFGESSDILPDVSFEGPSIVWLDDDQSLSRSILNDIEYVVSSLALPSAFAVSVNAAPWSEGMPDPDIANKRLAKLAEAVGDKAVPIGIDPKELSGWGTAKAYYRIIAETIQSVVKERHLADGATYQQLFHFNYSDDAKMLTMGGVLYPASADQSFRGSGIDKLPFFRNGAEPFHIKVPTLTFREMRYLDQFLPDGLGRLPATLIPGADAQDYAAIYRYFPLFAETDL